MEEIHEPHKTRHALSAALILVLAFGTMLASGFVRWGAPPPPAAMQISLIPDIPTPPPPPTPEPEPQPKPEPEPPRETAAQKAAEEEARRAEVVRAQKEKKRKEEEARKKRAAEKKRKEEAARKKREAEKKRKAEEEARKKREEEKKRKEEAERKKREEEERARKRAEAEAAAKAAAAQKALEARTARIANDYANRIIASIDQHLKTPSSVPNDSSIVVVVRVRLNHDGALEGLPEVVESSGYPEYDDAAVRAVLKSSPLPVPREPFITENEELMQQFLEHRLSISPN